MPKINRTSCLLLQKTLDPGTLNKMFTRSGYLFLMEKKALGTTGWSKCYCHYRREGRVFCMIPYNQVNNPSDLTLKKLVNFETAQKTFSEMLSKICESALKVPTLLELGKLENKRYLNCALEEESLYSKCSYFM